MLKNCFKSSLLFLALCTLFSSCDKHHAKKLSGTYSCKVHGKYYLMNQYSTDTTYSAELTITQDKKFLLILDKKIHIDSLWRENKYEEGSFQKYFQTQFKNDSLYVSYGSSSQSSNFSSDYACSKKK